MKIVYFQQVPYRHFESDFEAQFESVVTTPYRLVRPDLVAADYRSALDELMHAARAGFDGVAVTEHGQCSYDMLPNPDLFQAALSYATEIESLPVAIYPVGRSLGKTREPLRVAEELAMLDCMSNGRLVSGFPLGLTFDANINNGVPPMQTRARFDENLELILKAWTAKDPFPWNGKFAQHPAVNIWPRPIQRNPHPPVWITGSGSPETMKFALERGLGFNSFGSFGYRDAGARIFGKFWDTADELAVERNPYRLGVVQNICVAPTDAEAERLFFKHIEYFYRKSFGSLSMARMVLPGGVDIRALQAMAKNASEPDIFASMKVAKFADLMEMGAVFCGSPATVCDQILHIAHTYRIGNLMPLFQFGSMPHELTISSIDLFASAVLPRLRDVWAKEAYPHEWWPERLGGAVPSQRRHGLEKAVAS
jgi:alkanesulfonate monooxygenase SsuD/methylene tetrahydromethanopterin reductase-like flavin-dependent oxidoreductase (luciferase family)